MKKIILILILLSFINGIAHAEMYPSMDLLGGNLVTRADTSQRMLNFFSPNIDFTWELENNSLIGVNLGYNDFLNDSYYNYFEPKIRIQVPLKKDSSNISAYIFSTINAKILSNPNISTDVYNFAVGANLEYSIWDNISVGSAASLKYKTFDLLPEYNYFESPLQIAINSSFESKTSVRFELSLYNKIYSSVSQSEIYTIPGGNNNMGKKQSSLNALNSFNYAGRYEISLSAGQNLFETTGIGIKYKYSSNLNHYKSSSAGYTYDYFLDSDLYDDPYTYSANTISATLTQILPLDFKISLSYENNLKTYLESSPLGNRDETLNSFSLSLEKNISFESFITDMGFYLYYEQNINTSSLQYLNYNLNFIAAGISLSF